MWKNFELPAPAGPNTNNPIAADRRWAFIPAAKLLATLPAANDRLVLHKLDLPPGLDQRTLTTPK